MADEVQRRDPAPSDTGRDDQGRDDQGKDEQGDGSPLIPDADAGGTEAGKFSRDEKDHGRQDYGP